MKKDTSVDLDNLFAPKQQEQPQKQEQAPERVIYWDDILTEWSYRLPKGYPTIVDGVFTEYEEVKILNEILEERFGESVPLPEAAVSAPANDTGTKEGLVAFFATQKVSAIDQAIEKIKTKSKQKLSFDPSTIDPANYDGNPKASKNTINAIQYLNTQQILDPKLIKMFLNGLASGRYISKTLGPILPTNIDRGVRFSAIKEHAVELVQEGGVKLGKGESDKWCPADIFIYSSEEDANRAAATSIINVGKSSLNNIFADSFTLQKGKILGISLKEEKAQAGKATSFIKLLEKKSAYPDVTAIEPTQKALTALVYTFKAITKSRDLGYAAEALSIIQKTRPRLEKLATGPELIQLEQSLKKQLKKSLRLKTDKQLGLLQNSKGIYDKGLTRSYVKDNEIQVASIEPTLVAAMDAYKTSVVAFSKKAYAKSKNAFKAVLVANKFNEPKDVKKVDFNNVELLLKKAGCYDIASKLLNGLGDGQKLAIPPAFKNIILQKQNVFLAVTAYALSQGGISPTFFKLIGSESGGEAHVKPFYSEANLILQKGTDVEILDSGTFAGFEVHFYTQIQQGKKVVDKYEVTLGFQYAGDQFKIEVTELK